MTSKSRKLIDFAAAADLAQLPSAHDFQRRAKQWRKAMSAAARDAGLLPIVCAGAPLDPLDCVRTELDIRNGRLLSNFELLRVLGRLPTPYDLAIPDQFLGWEMKDVWTQMRAEVGTVGIRRPSPFRRWWVTAKQTAQRLRANLVRLPEMAQLAAPGPSSAGILCVARTRNHVADILPAVRWLRETQGWNSIFGIDDAIALKRLAAGGFFGVPISSTASIRPRATNAEAHRRFLALTNFIRGGHFRPDGFSLGSHRLLCEGTLFVLPRFETHVQAVADEIRYLIERFRIRLTLAGNPYTLEGRTALHVSNALGVPTATLEHGSIFPNDPMWDDCPAELICVWGEPSRRALLPCGISAERIAVTGAPRFDDEFKNFRSTAQDVSPAKVLVATSGPGDIVSITQFKGFIQTLYEAADLTPNIHWQVKLHPKDRPEYYLGTRPAGHPRVEIVRESDPEAGGIFRFLAQSRALVTISSTSALDAMAVNVPVIAVNVWPEGEGIEHVEFFSPRVTVRVRTAQELAAAASAAVAGTHPAEISQAAKTFAETQFANRGAAAAAVGKELARCCEPEPPRSHTHPQFSEPT